MVWGPHGVTENVGHLRADLLGLEGEVTLGFPVKVTGRGRDNEQKRGAELRNDHEV